MPNLKLQYSGHPILGKHPDAEKDGRQKEKRVSRVRWLDSITDSIDMNLSKFWEGAKDMELYSLGNPKTEGIRVNLDLTHFAIQQKLTQHCKATTRQ